MSTNEPQKIVEQSVCCNPVNPDYLLFPGTALPDALANLAALMQILCEHQQECYGVNLLQCMIRDTLFNLSTVAFQWTRIQSDDSSA